LGGSSFWQRKFSRLSRSQPKRKAPLFWTALPSSTCCLRY
jgi:hypothetical protein